MDDPQSADARDSRELWDLLLASGPDLDTDEDDDVDAWFGQIAELNRRGEPEPVEWATELLASGEPWQRRLAARTLADHGFDADYPFRRATAPLLAEAARTEDDDDVRATIVMALARTGSEHAADVLGYARDRSPDVRLVVAQEIGAAFDYEQLPPHALDVLIGLTTDQDPDIRDWATFSLGTQCEVDSPAIRDALRDRLDDSGDGDADAGRTIQGEALVGLARRHDHTVFDRLQRTLGGPADQVTAFDIEAAGLLADTRLLPPLQAFRLRAAASFGLADAVDEAVAALESTPIVDSVGGSLPARSA